MTMASNSGVAASQMDPEDSNSDLTVALYMMKRLIAQLETMLPVQVIAVNPGNGTPPAAGTVDVQLLVTLLDGANNPTQPGQVYGLPYFRLQGGPWAIVCDPAVNDFGYILSASRDISLVKKNPAVQNPGSLRKYKYSDAVYMGGILNAVPAATFWLKGDGTLVVTDKNGNVWESTSSGWTLSVGGTVVLTLTNSLATFSVNVKAPDFVTSALTSYVSHTHHVASAPGESNPPTSGT